MPARHRHHHSSERPKTFTMTLVSCSRSSGIGVHDAVETAFTNEPEYAPAGKTVASILRRLVGSVFCAIDVSGC
jgi:hypothetical protein